MTRTNLIIICASEQKILRFERITFERTLLFEYFSGNLQDLYSNIRLERPKFKKWSKTRIEKRPFSNHNVKQASTGGFSSICPPVHLCPQFQIFNGPSSESTHEMDGLCPNFGPLSMDWRMDGRSADGRLRPRRPDAYHMPHVTT